MKISSKLIFVSLLISCQITQFLQLRGEGDPQIPNLLPEPYIEIPKLPPKENPPVVGDPADLKMNSMNTINRKNRIDQVLINNSYKLDAHKVNQPQPSKDDYDRNNLMTIFEGVTYKEDEHYAYYYIKTPIFPYHITSDDIQVMIQNTQMQVRVLGSGNAINKSFNPNGSNMALRGAISYKSRDWEVWINLKDYLINQAEPAIKKTRNEDGSFTIKVAFVLTTIDSISPHFNLSVPTLRINKNVKNFYFDPYRLRIPKDPLYVQRIVNPVSGGTEAQRNSKIEYMTVESKVRN